MEILDIFPAKTTNPETGEEVRRIRAKTDDKQEFTVLNTADEIRKCGSMKAAINKLRLKQGQYGPYLQLSGYERTGESIFDQEEVEA